MRRLFGLLSDLVAWLFPPGCPHQEDSPCYQCWEDGIW